MCQLGCVEFIYTSVSGTDTLSFVTTPHAAPILARADFVNAFNLCHPFSTRPRDVYDQGEQHSDEDCLQDKLSSVNVAWHDEGRPVGIARKPEKAASAVRRKHQREQDSKKDG